MNKKFRVWNHPWGTWLKDHEFKILSDGTIEFQDAIEGNFYMSEEENVLQQFTGIKDKNGKEVYEGDILFWDGENEISWDDSESLNSINTVFFGNGAFRLEDDFPLSESRLSESEIIGNIFENPELLNEKTNN